MTLHQVGIGHDVAVVDMDPIVPQPHVRFGGRQVTRRTFGLDGTVHDDAPFVEFVWNRVGTQATYDSILAQFGVQSFAQADVTIITRGERMQFTARWNGVAVRPQLGVDADWTFPFPSSIVILVRNLEPSVP
jgi:hypothetical protein